MKTPLRFGAILLLCTVFSNRANAAPAPSQFDPDVNPYANQDPDGVPLSVTQPKQQVSAEEIQARRTQEAQALKNSDWLMRSYAQQLQTGANKGDQNSNLYYRVVTDKTLASIAGLTYLEVTPNEDTSSSLRTSMPTPGGTQGLRPTASPTNPRTTVTAPFKPLITPLGNTEAAGLHNFYNSSPAAPFLPPINNNPPRPMPSPSPSDHSSLDMPGQTAAESDPLNKNTNLTFDMDALPQKESHQELVELPAASNIDQLHKQEASLLNPPGVVPKSPKALPLNPVIIQIPEELKPAPIFAPPSTHGQIADPRDLIFH